MGKNVFDRATAFASHVEECGAGLRAPGILRGVEGGLVDPVVVPLPDALLNFELQFSIFPPPKSKIRTNHVLEPVLHEVEVAAPRDVGVIVVVPRRLASSPDGHTDILFHFCQK